MPGRAVRLAPGGDGARLAPRGWRTQRGDTRRYSFCNGAVACRDYCDPLQMSVTPL
jgi:hypothetical protein